MRQFTQAEIESLRRELHEVGVARVSSLLDFKEAALLEQQLELCCASRGDMFLDYNTGGRVLNGFFTWRSNEWLTHFTHETELPRLMSRVLSSQKINLFCDNIFFKGPNTKRHVSPWHNDQINWVVVGSQVATVWIALDDISRDTGAMVFARGSHRWLYPDNIRCARPGGRMELMADVCNSLGEDEVVCHELSRGDATIHLGNTLHAAGGNCSPSRRRRGYAIRYTGDDATYRPNVLFETPVPIELSPGGPLDSALFPVVFLEGHDHAAAC